MIPKWLPNTTSIPATFHHPRRGGLLQLLLIHYTGISPEAEWLARKWSRPYEQWPKKSGKISKRSAHFVAGRDGKVIQMVPLDHVAYHAGGGEFMGMGVNSRSVGIELCNAGFALRGLENLRKAGRCQTTFLPGRDGKHRHWELFSGYQMEALAKLVGELVQAVPTLRYVCGHEDVRPGKSDPGPAFRWDLIDWARLGLEVATGRMGAVA